MGFLSKYWQHYFTYEVIGRGEVAGRLAILIKASPTPENQDNRNYARIWINKERWIVLQIEWEPQSIVNLAPETVDSGLGELKRKVVWRVEYGVEEKEVFSLSHQILKEFLVDAEAREYLRQEIENSYGDYNFFTVELDVKYKKE